MSKKDVLNEVDELLQNAVNGDVFGDEMKVIFSKLDNGIELDQHYYSLFNEVERMDIDQKQQLLRYINLFLNLSKKIDIYKCLDDFILKDNDIYECLFNMKVSTYAINFATFKTKQTGLVTRKHELSYSDKTEFMLSAKNIYAEGIEVISEILMLFIIITEKITDSNIKKVVNNHTTLNKRILYVEKIKALNFMLLGVNREMRNAFSHISYSINIDKSEVHILSQGIKIDVISFVEFFHLLRDSANNIHAFEMCVNYLILVGLHKDMAKDVYDRLINK